MGKVKVREVHSFPQVLGLGLETQNTIRKPEYRVLFILKLSRDDKGGVHDVFNGNEVGLVSYILQMEGLSPSRD